jgi:glycosyltransferase involved in cell wall biosynthesis
VNQTLIPDQVLVIDADSQDQTREIAGRFTNVIVQSQFGQGLPNAWNQGLRAATGNFIAMIDSDDFWDPAFLERSTSLLSESPEALLALARVKYFVPHGVAPKGLRPELVDAERVGLMPGSTVCRRELFDLVGFFPENFIIASDIEWFAKIRELGIESVEVPLVGLNKRMSGQNFSLDPAYSDRYHSEIVEIARRRIQFKAVNPHQ